MFPSALAIASRLSTLEGIINIVGMDLNISRQGAGDAGQVLALFEKAFGSPSTLDHWSWKYTENPVHRLAASIGRDTSGAVVAHFAIVPVRLNFLGTPFLGGQIADVMVDPQHHRQGYITRVGEHCFGRLPAEGFGLVYAMPNPKGFLTTTRPLGGRYVTHLRTYFRRLSILREASGFTRSRFLGGIFNLVFRTGLRLRFALQTTVRGRLFPEPLKLETSQKVPSDYQDLWEANRYLEVLAVWKDTAYFSWRYDAKPNSHYRYFALRSKNRLEALAVGVVIKGELQLLEFQVREKHLAVARYFLATLTRLALREGVTKLVFKGYDSWFFDQSFHDFSRHVSYRSFFGLKDFNNEYSHYASLANNWTVTFGDSDVI